ncbi:PqqD family protein [Parasphingorhabdus sp.]|uniref:PqqD family protein n=1 Tax=Parasphingorhabdus sp. TaxID=2709688 RepID=UPI003FA75709
MSDKSKWVANKSVVYCELKGSVALLDTNRNVYFSLDGIGPFLWNYLCEGIDIKTLCQEVTSNFEVDDLTAKNDISALIKKLAEADLIRSSDN